MSIPGLKTADTGMDVVPDPSGIGSLIRVVPERPATRWSAALGTFDDIVRFTACHRYEPFWMEPCAGTTAAEVPVETQFLLAERADGSCLVLVPLIGATFRASLEGDDDGMLQVVIETGDPDLVQDSAVALFAAHGDDPYALVADSARAVRAFLGAGRLRDEKPLPAFVERFGWCTWDAFYGDVSHEKVREGLESFRQIGISPRYLILDDGWQSTAEHPAGGRRLTAFTANEKFPGDLIETVTMARTEFDLETFLVWHAIGGYWGGVADDALPGYGVRGAERRSSPGIRHYRPTIDTWWGPTVGVVPPEHIYRFYQDYHRHLRQQGVDGVKVDNQASLESVGAGLGGRVGLLRAYREALEGSVAVHFAGNLINCMSNASEMHVHTYASTLTRTSTDFWPNRPESHGLHLYTNAQVSLYFGEWVHPDWDMFQSGHAAGAYHAAGRALSGGPVYVSDKPGAHDAALLRKLVLPDGGILRAALPGRPTRDCLFNDPTKEDVLLKIVNGSSPDREWAGLLGLFNARFDAESPITVTGDFGPGDLLAHPDFEETERFAVYRHTADTLGTMAPDERQAIALPQLGWEIVTLVPVRDGRALLGCIDYFNGVLAADNAFAFEDDGGPGFHFTAQVAGHYLLFSAVAPSAATQGDDEGPVRFTYDAATGRLDLQIDSPGSVLIAF
jgi:raffinose synthase